MPLLHALSSDLESVIIITIVGYDYNYVWVRDGHQSSSTSPTLSSTDPGLESLHSSLSFVTPVFAGLLTPNAQAHLDLTCIAVYKIGDWGYILFLAAADLVMILRVYAMWNQSRKILAVLLFIYVPEIIITIVWESVYNSPDGDLSVTVVQLFNHTCCNYLSNGVPSQAYRAIPRFVLGAALMILSVIPTLKQSVEMYKFTKRWKTSRLMKLLAREGTAYFVVNLLFNIVIVVQLPPIDFMTLLNALSYSLSCTIMPRFIISIRESYDRDLRSRQQGIDIGFGVFPHQIANGNAALSAIAFVDVTEQNQVLECGAGDSRTIQLDALGDRARQEFLAPVADLYEVRYDTLFRFSYPVNLNMRRTPPSCNLWSPGQHITMDEIWTTVHRVRRNVWARDKTFSDQSTSGGGWTLDVGALPEYRSAYISFHALLSLHYVRRRVPGLVGMTGIEMDSLGARPLKAALATQDVERPILLCQHRTPITVHLHASYPVRTSFSPSQSIRTNTKTTNPRPRSAGAPPNVHHWHARQSTSGLSSSTFDTVFGASIPTLFVLSLIMCVVWRVKRAKRVQRSSRVAPRPVVHAPLGSGFGPVIAGILIGTRAGAAAREHGRLRNSEQVVMSSLACIEGPDHGATGSPAVGRMIRSGTLAVFSATILELYQAPGREGAPEKLLLWRRFQGHLMRMYGYHRVQPPNAAQRSIATCHTRGQPDLPANPHVDERAGIRIDTTRVLDYSQLSPEDDFPRVPGAAAVVTAAKRFIRKYIKVKEMYYLAVYSIIAQGAKLEEAS
ncbi:hypothetical protein HD554DRAFT_2042139 [Boletus coccyginus]|nr:hypothetical protein HD554DRAFT_2042139 [Boletus coccyginus]